MSRPIWSAVLVAVLATVLGGAVAAAPTDPPYPSIINLPAPTVDPTTGVVTTNFSPEGMAISGNTFYAGSTATGEIIKGNLETGVYQRNWVPASPNQPSDLHRGTLGLLVDSHNRLWAADSVGMACGTGTQPACPTGAPSPQFTYGAVFVYDATTGAELAQYTTTNAAAKTMNDITIADNAVFVSNTTAPGPPGTDNQFKIQLGPGGALPPGDTPPSGNTGTTTPCGTTLCPTYKNAAVTVLPTPFFTGADGIDTLPNGHVLFTSIAGAANGQMINMDPATGTFTTIAVTSEATRNPTLPPLLSLDGVTIDGNMLYAPENRTDTAACPAPNANLLCPGDWAAVHLDPPNYTTGEVIARLNSPSGSGIPPLRSPANMEQLGHFAYGISRVIVPVTLTNGTVVNTTQTFIEHLNKLPLTATGSPVSATEGASFSGQVAAVSDPNNGPISGDYPQNGSSVYGYTATVNWGDGTISTGTVTGTDSHIAVAGTHTYGEAGTYTVSTTVNDAATGLPLTTTTSTATVAEGALTLSGTAFSGVEGSNAAGAVATFTDADLGAAAGDYTATINWGDGSTPTTGSVTASAGQFTVSGNHAYAEEGHYTVTTTVTDSDAAPANTATATSTATVADAALSSTGTTLSGVENTAVSGVVAIVTDANAGGSASDLSSTINWGDGTAATQGTVAKSGGVYDVSGSHVYVTPGTYTVTTVTTDDGGSTTTTTSTITVAYSPGCTNAGEVAASARFLVPGAKDIHFELQASCNSRGGGRDDDHDRGQHAQASAVVINEAHATLRQGHVTLLDAKTDEHHTDITTVQISGHDAVIVGNDNGDSFIIKVHDGGRNAADTISIVITDPSGHVVFDSSTLTTKHADVHVEQTK